MGINGAIRDVLELTRDEVTKNGESVLTHFASPRRRLSKQIGCNYSK